MPNGKGAKGKEPKVRGKITTWQRVMRYKMYYFMLIPAICFYILFAYIPIAGNAIAFQDYKIGRLFFDSPWVGLKWFYKIFETPWFWDSVKNTVIINVLSIFCVFPAPIILALLLNEIRIAWFKKTVQTMTYMPHFLTWPMVAAFAFIVLNPNTGIINQIFVALGMERYSFLTENGAIRSIMIISWMWKEIGWGSILYLAAITSIPMEQYESAKLDGANKWQQIIKITIPSMAFIITFQFIFKVSDLFGASFDMTKSLVNAATYTNGMNISLYIYEFGLTKGQFAYGTAVSLLQSVVAFILLIGANTLAKVLGQDGVF